jgi:hypothetical protein
MKIELGGASVVEHGWMDVKIKGREIRLETTEESGEGGFSSITIENEEDEEFLKKKGIKIDEDFAADLYDLWQIYSNENLR